MPREEILLVVVALSRSEGCFLYKKNGPWSERACCCCCCVYIVTSKRSAAPLLCEAAGVRAAAGFGQRGPSEAACAPLWGCSDSSRLQDAMLLNKGGRRRTTHISSQSLGPLLLCFCFCFFFLQQLLNLQSSFNVQTHGNVTSVNNDFCLCVCG